MIFFLTRFGPLRKIWWYGPSATQDSSLGAGIGSTDATPMAHDSLRNHRKLRRLCGELGISKREAIGTLQFLWWSAHDAKILPDGWLRGFEECDIADGCNWPEDRNASSLCDALAKVGFLDPLDQPGASYAVHDYQQWAPDFVRRRWSRSTEELQALGLVPQTVDGKAVWIRSDGQPLCPDIDGTKAADVRTSDADVRTTKRNGTEPDPTQPNGTVGPDLTAGPGSNRTGNDEVSKLAFKFAQALKLKSGKDQRASLRRVASNVLASEHADSYAERLIDVAERAVADGAVDFPVRVWQALANDLGVGRKP